MLQEFLRFLRRAEIRLRHDLAERRSRAAVIHKDVFRSRDRRRLAVRHVRQPRRVLFHLYPPDSYFLLSHLKQPVPRDRHLILCNLKVLPHVRVEIRLSREKTLLRQLAVQRHPYLQRVLDGFPVYPRLASRESDTCVADKNIRDLAEPVRAPAEELCCRTQLNMNFQSDFHTSTPIFLSCFSACFAFLKSIVFAPVF